MQHPVSAAATVVDSIRHDILGGTLPPGTRLDEVSLGREHGVSRNTLREAFRLLAHDRLVEHRPHRGVFVRTVTTAEAHDLYAVRRMVEVGALRDAAVGIAADPVRTGPDPAAVDRIERSVAAAERAAEAGDWRTVGTMNGEFHLALTALADNPLVDRLMSLLITELRLVFLSVGTPVAVHARYLTENRRLVGLVRAGDLPRAAVALDTYLLNAERHLIG